MNGHLTLGENIADLGGMKIAYLALQKALHGKHPAKIDGFTPEQRFFIAFAQIWRFKARPEMQRVPPDDRPALAAALPRAGADLQHDAVL